MSRDINWRDVNGDGFEYLLDRNEFGDYFVKAGDGFPIKREKKESKMTREEAIKIVKKIGSDLPWYEAEVVSLEALGLIRFDEPKQDKRVTLAAQELKLNFPGMTLDHAREFAEIVINSCDKL